MPDEASRPVAAIDIGTNTVRLLVLGNEALDTHGEYPEAQARALHITRLGQGVDRTGKLHPDAIERTLAALESFVPILERHRVERLRAVTTSAARDAENRDTFMDRAEAVLGTRPELLTGTEEAQLSFSGATSGHEFGDAEVCVLDIGGGSTEFAVGHRAPERSVSLNVGSVRVTEKFLHSDPPSKHELEEARAWLEGELGRPLPVDVPCGRETTRWLAVAGTATTLAARILGLQEYAPRKTHGMKMDRAELGHVYDELARATEQERRPLLIEPRRADVIVGGCLVLLAVMDHYGVSRMTASECDILDGIALALLRQTPEVEN